MRRASRAAVTVNEIDRALAVMRVQFKSGNGKNCAWPKETFIDRCRREGHLSEVQIWAFDALVDDIDRARGNSGGTASGWLEYVDRPYNVQRVPVIYENTSKKRLDALGETLTREETALLLDLMADFYDKLDGHFMPDIGELLSKFKNKDHVRGLTVGKTTSLLNRIAKFYGRG